MTDQLPDMSHLPEHDQQAIQDFASYLREKSAEQRRFHIGQRVRILIPLCCGISQQDTIYNYTPSRRWAWHVRPDGRTESEPGIAFTAEELQPIEEEKEVKPS